MAEPSWDTHSFEVEDPALILPDGQPASYGPRSSSRRKRLTQFSFLLVALVVVVVTFHRLIFPATSTPGGQASPLSAALPPITTLITSNITFGTVTLNGQRQRGTVPMFFIAHSATYQIRLDAPPFRPVSCTLIFSRAGYLPTGAGNCVIGSGDFPPMTANGITATPEYSIEFDFTAADLPPDQVNRINTLLAHAVTAQQTTTVPAGSYVGTSFKADDTITGLRPDTALQATASLAASTTFWRFRFGCQELICEEGSALLQLAVAPNSTVWLIGVPVALRWRFTTAAGDVLGDVSFPVADLLPKLLAYHPDVGWSLSSQQPTGLFTFSNELGSFDCQTGMLVLQPYLQARNLGYGGGSEQGIEGCMITVIGSASSNQGTFLWRFGVLLAADTPAHDLMPTLPIATSAEIAAVQG